MENSDSRTRIIVGDRFRGYITEQYLSRLANRSGDVPQRDTPEINTDKLSTKNKRDGSNFSFAFLGAASLMAKIFGVAMLIGVFVMGLYKDKLLAWLERKENSPNSFAMTISLIILKSAVDAAPPIYQTRFAKIITNLTQEFKSSKNFVGVIMGILRKRVNFNKWLSNETMQSTLAVIAASRKQLSSGSSLIMFMREDGRTNKAWLLTVSISLVAVSLFIILWNLGLAVTSISSLSISGEITGIKSHFSNALMILRQEGLLINPQIKTLVSITALSIFFFAVCPYFFNNLFFGNRKFFKASIDILKDLFPAKRNSFFFQSLRKFNLFSIRHPFNSFGNLLGAEFYNKLRHFYLRKLLTKKHTIFSSLRQDLSLRLLKVVTLALAWPLLLAMGGGGRKNVRGGSGSKKTRKEILEIYQPKLDYITRESKIAGYIVYGTVSKNIQPLINIKSGIKIYFIAVHPDFSGQGIAEELYKKVANFAYQNAIEAVVFAFRANDVSEILIERMNELAEIFGSLVIKDYNKIRYYMYKTHRDEIKTNKSGKITGIERYQAVDHVIDKMGELGPGAHMHNRAGSLFGDEPLGGREDVYYHINKKGPDVDLGMPRNLRKLLERNKAKPVTSEELFDLLDDATILHERLVKRFLMYFIEEIRKLLEKELKERRELIKYKDLLNDDYVEKLLAGGEHHDIGKHNEPFDLLYNKIPKPELVKLAEKDDYYKALLKKLDETQLKHPSRGAFVMEKFGFGKEVFLIVYHHHENWGGTGYPDVLKGEEIPLGARLIRIIDTFTVMVYGRPYQKTDNIRTALEKIKKGAGLEFDPDLTEIFVGLDLESEKAKIDRELGLDL